MQPRSEFGSRRGLAPQWGAALHSAILCAAAAVAGCSDADRIESPTIAATGPRPARGGTERVPIVVEHDLGTVLSSGGELSHEFTLVNAGTQPVRIIGGEALTPCCSSLGSLPESISSGGRAVVPVVFRTRGRRGPQRMDFTIGTDGPAWLLRLKATLIPDWEVEEVDVPQARFLAGEGGQRRMRLVCRKKGSEGLSAPEFLEASGPLAAAFEGPAEAEAGPGGLVTTRRLVRASILPSLEMGPRSGLLTFRWPGPDSETRTHTMRWVVESRINATPQALFLRAPSGPSKQTVVVRSRDRPFRVIGVTGPLAGPPDLPAEPRLEHVLKMTLEPGLMAPNVASDIHIRTDDPDQPEVTLTALMIERKGISSR